MRDEEIIRAIQAGDESAMRQAMDRYSRLLWSIASAVLYRTASTQDMEECVADTFIYLWQHSEKYDPQRGTLRSWLSIITRSRALDRCRLLIRQSSVPLEEALTAEGSSLTDGLLRQEDRNCLRAALRTLSDADQELLFRRYYREQKPKEIALALGLPVKQVENRLYRSRQKLKDIMNDENRGYQHGKISP